MQLFKRRPCRRRNGSFLTFSVMAQCYRLWKSGEARECFDKVERGGILLRKVAEILSGVSGTKVPSTTLNIPRKKLKRTLSITSAPFEG